MSRRSGITRKCPEGATPSEREVRCTLRLARAMGDDECARAIFAVGITRLAFAEAAKKRVRT